ncbi:uncharacterized protein LOC124112872 isoform X1 [Haliotis rufescens]|uniref:uncharacterized protein LOC124112872 isoform X1 n=1 Tax=Haliotis rufescens TaxID=6454 RepID=UPI00201F9362|nr:uncharacterized protein LOC124112872 isoform X1 [Haliotis rufescens]XP_046328999.2 uncharacterized protein LOC124112872 isoform X1 [Haliotis rufescens]
MKAAAIFTLFLLVSSVHGNGFTDFFKNVGNKLGSFFTTVGHSLLHQLDTTGVDLLNAGVSAGKQLVSQGLQALALNTANALQNRNNSKRALSPEFQRLEADIHGVIDKAGDDLKRVITWAEGKVSGILVQGVKGTITPDEALTKLKSIVGMHNTAAGAFEKLVLEGVEGLTSSMTKDHKSFLSAPFKAHLESLTRSITEHMLSIMKSFEQQQV